MKINRTVLYSLGLITLGLVVGAWLTGHADEDAGAAAASRLGSMPSTSAIAAGPREAGGSRLEQQLAALTARLAEETRGRRLLEERLEGLASELASLRDNHRDTTQALASKVAPTSNQPVAEAVSNATAETAISAEATTLEHALVAAGIDARTATEIKRRRDELTMSEIYLRDLATREGWMETPDFASELAKIEAQRKSVRDEIGDDAYDRYLAAMDHPNRVAVDEVFLESPAATAGMQTGDVVLRYGDTRIFAPAELVAATRGGTAGERVRVEILRQGQRLEVDVPRGPLGVRIDASRANPDGG